MLGFLILSVMSLIGTIYFFEKGKTRIGRNMQKISICLSLLVLISPLCILLLDSFKWGGGWLDAEGAYDFAGSTTVHAPNYMTIIPIIILITLISYFIYRRNRK